MEGLEFMATKTANQVFTQIGDDVIELQGAELKALLETQKEMQDKIAAEQAEAEAKEAAKAIILDRIGLTANELKLILG